MSEQTNPITNPPETDADLTIPVHSSQLTIDLTISEANEILDVNNDEAISNFLENLNTLLSEAADTVGAAQRPVRVVITISP